jgi:hypothetical protein
LGISGEKSSDEFVLLAISSVSQIATGRKSTLALLNSGKVLEATELDGFIEVDKLRNISKIVCGN